MSRYIQKIVLLLLLFISQFTYSQIYPVQAVPVVLSPYSSKLSDYSNPMVNRINLQLITTDLLVTNRPALLFVKIQGNGITAQSAPVLSGINPIYLNGGEILSLTSADIAGYFRFQNLQGLTTTRYSDPLPDGVYTICFQVYDLMTKKWLSQNSCATVYLMLNDPPQLNLPSNNEQLPSTDFPNIVFSWTPRHLNATNVSYEFELKEILNTSLDPAFAFEVSPLLLKEENLRTSTLLYDVTKPTLIPGKTYAWRVKAVSTNGLAENAVFKNNGYSQVFSFKYTANCSAPRFLLSEQQSRSGVKLMWQGENSHKKYHIQYRKANVENAEWFEVHTINTQTLLQGLEAGFTYEFRVGASCEMEQYGTPQSFVYSGIQTFTINKEENATSYNCGIVPKIEITNQQPLGAMVVHETFMAGDFPVKVLEVTGSNGIFSGSGYIQVPYLFDTRIGVEFNNVRINSDYQLIDGVVETTYDPDWSNVDFIDDLWDVNQQSETVDFPINSADDITVSPGGDIVVTGPDGQTETFPGGKDTVITDSTGKSYYVDAEGNVSGPFDQADGGKPTPENTDGVDKNGEVTALTAEGIKVTFEKINNETQYAFDLVTYGKELTKDYKKVDGLFVPFKAVPNGLSDKILAKVTLSGTNVVADSLFFKTQNGMKIDAVKEGEHFVLTLKGAQKFAVEEVQATIKQGNKYKIAGVFNLVHVSPRTVKLKLVPTSSSINVADKIDEIKAVYNQLAINVQVDVLEPFDISGYLEGGKLPTENEFGDLSTYSDAQKAIINDFTKQRNPEQAYYIFVTNATSSTGQDGYMALGNQFGFVFNQSAKTIAHEFGHGALRLEHPFKQYKNKGLKKEDTQSIMDYANGTELLFTDWKQINDPKFRLYAFQGQSDGEIKLKDGEYLGFTPDAKIFTLKPEIFTYDSESYFITSYQLEKNGEKYTFTNGKYISTSGKEYTPNDNSISGKVALWFEYNDCYNLYKFINVDNYTSAKKKWLIEQINTLTNKGWTLDRSTKYNPQNCLSEKETLENLKVDKVDDDGNRIRSTSQTTRNNNSVYNYTDISQQTIDQILESLVSIDNEIAKSDKKGGINNVLFITKDNDQVSKDLVLAEIERIKNSDARTIYLWLNFDSVDNKKFDIISGGSRSLPAKIATNDFQKFLGSIQKEIFGDYYLGSNENPFKLIFDGLAHVVSQAKFPPRFYDPTLPNYNGFVFKYYNYVASYIPANNIADAVLQKANLKIESNVTTNHLVFAYYCGVWNGIVNQFEGLAQAGSLLSQGVELIFNKEMQEQLSSSYNKWKTNCDQNNSSSTYAGCAWDMVWDGIKQSHTTGSSPKIAEQYGESTIDVAAIAIAFTKVGKLSKVNSFMEAIDPLNQVMKYAGKGVKVTFKGVGTAGNKAFVYVFDQARKLEKYEVRFNTGKLYAGIPFPDIRKKLDDVALNTDLEKIPADENGIRILEVDGEAIPIGPEGKIDELVNQAGKASLLTKFKDFTNIKTWINGLNDVADAGLLAKLNNLESSYFSKLDADLIHSTYGPEIKALVKESPDDLTDIWKRLKDDPAYSWELQKEGGNRWEKWGQREFFKDITAKGKGFETNVCLTAFKNRTSAKYLELKNKFQADFGKNLNDYDMYSQVQLKYDGDNYFVADQLFVKYKTNALGQQVVDDIVVIENKLSSTTPLTTPQANALTKTSFTVRSNDINSATPNGSVLIKGTKLDFSNSKQWYKVHDGVDGNIITGISKM